MLSCWDRRPKRRPSFQQIKDEIITSITGMGVSQVFSITLLVLLLILSRLKSVFVSFLVLYYLYILSTQCLEWCLFFWMSDISFLRTIYKVPRITLEICHSVVMFIGQHAVMYSRGQQCSSKLPLSAQAHSNIGHI